MIILVRAKIRDVDHQPAGIRIGERPQEQRVPGYTEVIQYEDEKGKWHTETASGSDRPDTDVKDSA